MVMKGKNQTSNYQLNLKPLFRFAMDIEDMLGSKPFGYWKFTWKFIAPLLTAVMFGSSIYGLLAKPMMYTATLVSGSIGKLLYLFTTIKYLLNFSIFRSFLSNLGNCYSCYSTLDFTCFYSICIYH